MGLRPDVAAGEPPPETTRLRLYETSSPGSLGCAAPRVVALEFLRAEGFNDVQYVQKPRVEAARALASGETDMNATGFVGNYLVEMDAGGPIAILAGVHVG